MLNPCELEIALFCHGLRLADDASLDGSRAISRTRAGLGSGLELTLPRDRWHKRAVWVNAPVVEPFVQHSPFVLQGGRAGYRSWMNATVPSIPSISRGRQREEMRSVMAHVYRACRSHWIPIGAAPNIEVSIVVNPDDTSYLAEPGLHTAAYELYRRTMKVIAAPLFKRRMRPRLRSQVPLSEPPYRHLPTG